MDKGFWWVTKFGPIPIPMGTPTHVPMGIMYPPSFTNVDDEVVDNNDEEELPDEMSEEELLSVKEK